MIQLNDFKRQWQLVGNGVIDAVQRVGQSGWYILGQEVEAFESALAQFSTIAELLRSNRVAFAEEVRLNRKAVFLNFLFWAQSDCGSLGASEGLRQEVTGAIRQTWQSKAIEIPLPMNR